MRAPDVLMVRVVTVLFVLACVQAAWVLLGGGAG